MENIISHKEKLKKKIIFPEEEKNAGWGTETLQAVKSNEFDRFFFWQFATFIANGKFMYSIHAQRKRNGTFEDQE